MTAENAYQAIVAAPGFALGVRCTEDEITGIEFIEPQAAQAPANPLAAEAVRQLQAYLADPGFVFGLPLQPAGTAFQRRVWGQIAAIPLGAVETYGQVADQIRHGYEEAERTVQRHPTESVLMAFGGGLIAGVIVGLILRSR